MPPITGSDNGTAGYGVFGNSPNGDGVRGSAPSGSGLHGITNAGIGVYAESNSGMGVYAFSDSGDGVRGGSHRDNGVVGLSERGVGVHAESVFGIGVYSRSYGNGNGVSSISASGNGVVGESNNRNGVVGGSKSGNGVVGESNRGNGVRGFSNLGSGVVGVSNNNDAVVGISQKAAGIVAQSFGWHALYTKAWNAGFRAAFFDGSIEVRGSVLKTGGGFKIDHPINPEKMYLSHSFVESADMKNMYDGVVALDNNGDAEIELPNWFTTLNKDFRYQLTAIGSPAPNLYIAKPISDTNRNPNNSTKNKQSSNSTFKIAGGATGMKVCWQVTGIRKDPWANAHRIKVEEDKPSKQRGLYLYPELYGKPEKKGFSQQIFGAEENRRLLKGGNTQKIKPIKLNKFIMPNFKHKLTLRD